MKKGEVNWILIGFIIALIVLVVLLFILYGKMADVNKNLDLLNSCEENRHGQCKEDSCSDAEIKVFAKCDDEKEICCIPISLEK